MTCKVHGNVNANDAHNYSAKKSRKDGAIRNSP